MDDNCDSPAPPHPDPEVEALLDFEPVVRRCVRHDGWLPARQREFIVALAVLGHAQQAAIAVGGTMSGAYKLRTAEGGEGFAAAWDSALALHLRRHPRPEPKGRPSRGEIEAGTGRKPWPDRPATPPEGWVDPKEFFVTPEEFREKILKAYFAKLKTERQARLAGRIVEADFIVRQLAWLEVAIDCLGGAFDLLEELKRSGVQVGDIAATPWSLYFDNFRRLCWRKMGEPERPQLPPLGRCHGEVATGERSHNHYAASKDGTMKEWTRREDDKAAVRAEAQLLWEEKAKAEAEAWRARVEAEGSGAAANGEEREELQ